MSRQNGPFNTPDARDFFIATISELTVSNKSSQSPTAFTREKKPPISHETLIGEWSRSPDCSNLIQNDEQAVLNWYLFFTLYVLRTEFELSEYDVIPLLLTAMQVTGKCCYDKYCSNKYAASVFGTSLGDLNKMEAQFLTDSNYKMYIHPETDAVVKNGFESFKADPKNFTGKNFACFWHALGLESRRTEAGIPDAMIPFTPTVIFDDLREFGDEPQWLLPPCDSDDDASTVLFCF